jgi:hypothetical protein
LTHEVGGLFTRQIARAVFTATNFPNEVADAHDRIVKQA